MTSLEPLWKIEEELAALLDSVDVCSEEQRPELEARIAQYLGAEVEKVDRVGAVLSSLEHVAANAKAEIDRLTDRRQSAERAAERLKRYILYVLSLREGRPLKGHNVTLSARESEAVRITDPSAVPERFKKTTVSVEIPKDPVKRALKAGEEVPGAVLEKREHLVRR